MTSMKQEVITVFEATKVAGASYRLTRVGTHTVHFLLLTCALFIVDRRVCDVTVICFFIK